MAHHLKQAVSDVQLVCPKIKQLNDCKVFKLVCALWITQCGKLYVCNCNYLYTY